MDAAVQPAKVTPARIGWDAHCLRVLTFLEERLTYGQALGYILNSQNGEMDRKAQSKPSTKAEIDLWNFNQSRRLGLLSIRENEQGLRLWAYYSQRDNPLAYQFVPDGGDA